MEGVLFHRRIPENSFCMMEEDLGAACTEEGNFLPPVEPGGGIRGDPESVPAREIEGEAFRTDSHGVQRQQGVWGMACGRGAPRGLL